MAAVDDYHVHVDRWGGLQQLSCVLCPSTMTLVPGSFIGCGNTQKPTTARQSLRATNGKIILPIYGIHTRLRKYLLLEHDGAASRVVRAVEQDARRELRLRRFRQRWQTYSNFDKRL